jgi:hypothetical protein
MLEVIVNVVDSLQLSLFIGQPEKTGVKFQFQLRYKSYFVLETEISLIPFSLLKISGHLLGTIFCFVLL